MTIPINYARFMEIYPNWRGEFADRLDERGEHLLAMGSGKPGPALSVKIDGKHRRIDLSRVVFYESNPEWDFKGMLKRNCAEIRCVNHSVHATGIRHAPVYVNNPK